MRGMSGQRGAGRLAAVRIEQVFVNEDNSPTWNHKTFTDFTLANNTRLENYGDVDL